MTADEISGPSELQLELFRSLEDVHELSEARVVLLVDEDGRSIAVSGDEAEVPEPLRAALSGRSLAAAGSVVALLGSVDGDFAGLNVTVYDVDGEHVLAIVFDAEADLETVQSIGSAARASLADLLRSAPS